jgi:signal transduction histidine kinase
MTKETRSRIYIGALAAAAASASALAAWVWPFSLEMSRLWMAPTLALMVAVAGRFPFRVSPQGDATLVTVPLFMSALLLHPLEAALVGMAGTLISECLLKAPARALIFNVSNSTIMGVLAGIVFWSLRPEVASGLFTPGLALAAAAAGLVIHAANLSILFGMITLVKGRGFWQRWREAWVFEAVLEGSLLTLGLIGAQLVTFAWWWLLVLAVPFVVAYYGFRHSVEEAAQKARLAEELDKNLNQLKETQNQLIQSAKLATVGTLAAGVAHEINNPLTIITGRAELMLAKLDKSPEEYLKSDKPKTDIQDVLNMGIRISTIVNQLLAYSRRSDQLSNVQLSKVLDDALVLIERKLEKKGVKLVKDYQQTPMVTGVPNQLQQVFVNLVGNALDATPSWGNITLGCTVEDGMAVAYVKDTGVGIPPEIRERLFEPFFTTKEVGKGTGLGLFICHKIVADHKGAVTFESEQGVGTTFWVKLPLAETMEQAQPAAAATAAS